MKQCSGDCGEGTDWRCAGDAGYSTAPAPTNAPIHVLLNDPAAKDVVFPGVTLTPCRNVDCTERVGEPCTSDAAGHCEGTLTVGFPGPAFNGFLRASGGDSFPTMYFIHPRVTGVIAGDASYAPQNVAISTKMRMATAFALARNGGMPGRAHVIFQISDCTWANGKDVALTVSNADDKTEYFCVRGGFPVRDCATDESGVAAALNVPAAPDMAVIVRGKVGESVVAETAIHVEANTLTYSILGPR